MVGISKWVILGVHASRSILKSFAPRRETLRKANVPYISKMITKVLSGGVLLSMSLASIFLYFDEFQLGMYSLIVMGLLAASFGLLDDDSDSGCTSPD